MAEASAGTREYDPVAWASLAVLESTVNSKALIKKEKSQIIKFRGDQMTLTAQRIEAAAALSRLSGMAVTEWT